MDKTNLVKDIAIIADFIISIVASSVKNSNPTLSDTLFAISGVVLTIAVICVLIEFFKKK
jgi:hypothetical protein